MALPLTRLVLLALAALSPSAPVALARCSHAVSPPSALDSVVPDACVISGLEVTSWSRATVVNASTCNDTQPRIEFADQPEVRFVEAVPDAWYTLVMVDPGAPSLQSDECWLHWMVVNIKGSDFQQGYMDEATEVASYEAPAAWEEAEAHRFVFLAFEQAADAPPLAPDAPLQRPHFRLGPWVRDLRALCGPLAGVQFRSGL